VVVMVSLRRTCRLIAKQSTARPFGSVTIAQTRLSIVARWSGVASWLTVQGPGLARWPLIAKSSTSIISILPPSMCYSQLMEKYLCLSQTTEQLRRDFLARLKDACYG